METQITKKQYHNENISFQRILKEIGRNAYMDWIAIIFLNFITVLIVLSFSVYIYNVVINIEKNDVALKSFDNSQILDRKALSGLISEFDKKDERGIEAKRGYSGDPDPSI